VRTSSADARFIVLVYPLRGEAASEVVVEPVVGGGGVAGFLLRRPGYEDLVCFPHGEAIELDEVPDGAHAVAVSRPAGTSNAFRRKLFEIGVAR
jgi:hypothetical protein